MKVLFWLIFAVLTAGAFAHSAPAAAMPSAAPINFCNRTSETVNVASGYYSSGVNDNANHDVLTGPFVSEGWYTVDPNTCQSFRNPFNARYMFWYPIEGHAPRTHTPVDDVTNSGRHMCITGPHFTFEDQNVSIDACHSDPAAKTSAGAKWVLVNKVDTELDPNVNFTGYNY